MRVRRNSKRRAPSTRRTLARSSNMQRMAERRLVKRFAQRRMGVRAPISSAREGSEESWILEFVARRQPTDVGTLRREQHLSDVAAVLDEMMCRGGLAKAERPRDPRPDRA